MKRKILLITDQSESAERAAQIAGEFAQQFEAQILVIYIQVPIPAMTHIAEESGDTLPWSGTQAGFHGLEQAAERILKRTASILKTWEVPFETRLERGHPAVRACQVALKEQSDLVVVGHQGVKRATALHLEDVNERISECAHCPLLVVN
jgi:nucleotide-binding universal stress UspA family protein